MSQENHSPVTNNNNNNKSNRGKNSNKNKQTPLATMNNNNDGFTKLKSEDKKRKRKPKNEHVTVVAQEESFQNDEDIFSAQGYTNVHPLLFRSKNPIRTYSKNMPVTRPHSTFFDQSQDSDMMKCAKCEKLFPMETYEDHTNLCLNDSITIN